MSNNRFQIIFDKLDEINIDEQIISTKQAEIRFSLPPVEFAEISELRRLSMEIQQPEVLSYTTV